MMTMTNAIDCQVIVRAPRGRHVQFNAKRLEEVLNSLTNNSAIINRAGILILAQLRPYKLIKAYDLKCIIYRTLKQLSYDKLAQHYYQLRLA